LWANRAIGPGLELVLAAGVDSDAADVASGDGMVHQGGRTTIGNGAVGLQLRRGAWKLDAAVGGAAPTGASPWPEAKLTVTWAPRPELALSLVGAQKGRVPTLRERYALGIGNEALDPELARFGEAKLSVRGGGASLSGAGYVRAVDGMIRLNDARTELVNIGAVTLMGVDVDGKYTPAHLSWLTVGASWHFIDADGEMSGEPVDFLPAHKLDGSLRLTWKQHGGLSARVRWVDERLDNGVTLPSYTTADVSAFYDVRTDLRATMRIDNLADERYLARQNGYHDPGRLVLIGLEGVWE
jgi:outer membrane cobalamin receptor